MAGSARLSLSLSSPFACLANKRRNVAITLFSIVESHLIDLKTDEPRSTLQTMPRTRKDVLEERCQLEAEYGDLFDFTAALLFRHDPVCINFEINPDEYEAEAGSILPRLQVASLSMTCAVLSMRNLSFGSMRRLLAHRSDICKLLLRFGSYGKYLDNLRHKFPTMVDATLP
jgi:hypothetical protein